MSIVQWGSDAITMGRVLDYRVTSVLSEDGIDYIETRYDVDFQGVVSLDLGANPVAAARQMQERMLQPRKAFALYIADYTTAGRILESDAPDIKGGPKCNSVTFTQFQGSRTAICNASFTIFKHDCRTGVPTVLSNRWSTNSVIDHDYYTRLTINGELHVNPFKKFGADAVRDQCFRQVPQGMQPVHASFVQSTDGLRLNYTIVFQEKYQLPPGVATDIKCEYTESSENGAKVTGECFCDVSGPKTATKAALFDIAMGVVNSRFNFGVPGQAGKDIFMGGIIREVMHDNRVSVCLRAIKTQAAQLQGAGPLRMDPNVFGKPIPGAPAGKGAQIPVWGNAAQNGGYKAVAAAWKALVCADTGATSPNELADLSFVGDSPIVGLTYRYGELPPPDTSRDSVSARDRDKPHLKTQYDAIYKTIYGVLPLPSAKRRPKGEITSEPLRDQTSWAVRVHQPLSYKIIHYKCSRVGAMPVRPKVTTTKDYRVISNSFHGRAPVLMADGVTPYYEASGTIIISINGEADPHSEDIVIGVDPSTDFTIEEQGTLKPGDWAPGLLEPPP